MIEKKTIIKKRNWAFVAYPESLPKDWIEKLKLTGLQCSISPLHDKDLEADEKTSKKPHYHIILVYGSPTTYRNVLSLTQSLRSTNPIPLEQIRGYYRYFTHKDNPEKYQYHESEIVNINGFDIRNYVELTTLEIDKIKIELQQLVRDENIVEYSDLLDYLVDNNLLDQYSVASRNTLLFNTYITSRRNKKVAYDETTGEVIE